MCMGDPRLARALLAETVKRAPDQVVHGGVTDVLTPAFNAVLAGLVRERLGAAPAVIAAQLAGEQAEDQAKLAHEAAAEQTLISSEVNLPPGGVN
jgi:hypothetical protein